MRKAYFFHIPKTAGTSVLDYLAARIDPASMARADGIDAVTACAQHSDAALIAGHAWFTPGVPLPSDRYWLTLLRDPVDRALSAYYFFRRPDNLRGDPNVDLARSLSLEAWVDSDDAGAATETCDYQTRLLASLDPDGASDDPARRLAAAKRTLDRFDLVGTVDALPDWLDLLSHDLRFAPAERVPRTNTTERPAIASLDPAVVDRLRAKNRLDAALVDYARAKLVARRRDAFRALMSRAPGHVESKSDASASSATTPQAATSVPAPAAPPLRAGTGTIEVARCRITGRLAAENAVIAGDRWTLVIDLLAHEPANDVTVGFQITNAWGRIAWATNSRHAGYAIAIRKPGEYRVAFTFEGQLGLGTYHVGVAVHAGLSHLQHCFDRRDRLLEFSVVGSLGGYFEGYVRMYPRMSIEALADPSGVEARSWSASSTAFRLLEILNPPIASTAGEIRVAGSVPTTLVAGATAEIQLDVRNDGPRDWPAFGTRPVNLAYRWRRPDGELLVQDGLRTPLPANIEPGRSLKLWLTVQAPDHDGPCVLLVAPVQEGVRWLNEVGGPCLELPIVVER